MPDVFGEVSPQQENLLRVIAGPMLESGHWPNWQYVEAMMYPSVRDVRELLTSLPKVGSFDGGWQYGPTWYDHRNLSADNEIRLTIAAGLLLPDYFPIAENFIQALQVLVERVQRHKYSALKAEHPVITSAELAARRPRLSEDFVRLLPELIRSEPFVMSRGFGIAPGGAEWTMTLGRELLNYEGVVTVRDYVERVVERVEADNRKRNPDLASSTAEPERRPGFDVRMFSLLIASPGDLKIERGIVEQVVAEVNAAHCRHDGLALLPLRWERDSVSGFGDGPQAIINEVGDQADIVVALFRSRLGTPTESYASGTVEEVERAIERGAEVHVIFLEYGRPSTADADQQRKLDEWRLDFEKRGLLFSVAAESELRSRLHYFFVNDLRKLGKLAAT
ncbi:hypothetical protein [Umezawaea sp. NPDC059074]|uniref:hypothetical protein n=1 Tax=Umezawaea sp. NPDC059074 TaxID=3346716 RepID=UPI00368C70BD